MDVQGLKSRHTLLKEYAYTRGDIDRGYNNRTLYVNLSENSVAEKPVSEEMKEKFIGGKGFGLRLLFSTLLSWLLTILLFSTFFALCTLSFTFTLFTLSFFRYFFNFFLTLFLD